jgi:uncharacterized protein YjiS (DUF1127 family)
VADSEPERRNREMNDLIRALAKGTPAGEETRSDDPPAEYRFLNEKRQVVELKILQDHADQDIALREKYAQWLLKIVAADLVLVNGIFVAYAWAGEKWKLPEGVIQIWLGATFVQIVGVVGVVTRYLFYRRDQSPSPPTIPTRTRGG